MNGQSDSRSIKISIIIPFYDSENYVARCLDSVLSQDMPDFEIIAVNDGSPDSTPSLLEEYAKKDRRIQIVNLKNGGVAWARNQGVLKAKGEYLMFIDGDDFILPGCLTRIYNHAQSNDADVIIFSHIQWQDGVFGKPHQYPYPQNTVIDALTATRLLLIDGDFAVWNKIIKRKLYMDQNINFAEGRPLEDFPVSYQMLSKSKRIVYLDTAFYAYVQRSISLSHSPLTARVIRDLIYSFDFVEEEIRKAGWEHELAEAFDRRYIDVLTFFLRTCYSNPNRYKSIGELKEAKSLLKERFSNISFSRIFSNQYFKLSYKTKAARLKLGIYKWEKAATRIFR